MGQGLFKAHSEPLMVSLSNHERLERASFDKLRTSARHWMALLCEDPDLWGRAIDSPCRELLD